jgi:UDP-GlcNAc:undecaprenyl-phosphate GlcNAc-1-phosphate transferase
MFTAWIVCIAAGIMVSTSNLCPEFFSDTLKFYSDGIISVAGGQLLWVVIGAAGAVILGLADDKWAMKAHWKFLGQFILAFITVYWGHVRINMFVDNDFFSIAITVFWFMLLMNSINFFDNMDGLAVGTIAISMGFFAVIAALNQEYFFAIFAALNFGVCCGFWIFNANPASIFMGDSGSHFLGFLAAVVSAGVSYFDLSYSQSRFPVIIPCLILALPLFDTFMVVVIRTLNKKPFWIGDHNHISHRFVRMGLSRKYAVMMVHILALLIGLGSFPLMWGDFKIAVVMVVQILLLLLLITILQFKLDDTVLLQ